MGCEGGVIIIGEVGFVIFKLEFMLRVVFYSREFKEVVLIL